MSWSAESRLAEKIRERVANCVLFELQDPRISFVTVTRVRLARDMSKCTVFYSVLGTAAERTKTAHALRDASGFVQREVARILRTRVTPHLDFAYDDAIEGGMRMTNMLDQLEQERGEAAPVADESSKPESGVDPAAKPVIEGSSDTGSVESESTPSEAKLSDQREVEARVEREVAAARERMAAVEEGHRRWNRMEEAMEAVCEEAISIFDQVGRAEAADEIQSHMAAHDRFDLLVAIFRDEAEAIAAEAESAGLTEEYRYCCLALPAFDKLAEGVRHHRPGA